MKRIITSLLLFFVSVALYAQDTNYSSSQECFNDVSNYATKALDQNQSSLARWFLSFSHDSESKIDYINGTVTIYNGCRLIGANASEGLWKKMQAKLDQQIAQQKAGLPSLYGNRAILICKYSDVTHRIDINSCK